ncbi:NADH:flavorubredoxin reductase NorW [Photobacterium rosenbergii]|uniref:NADH:flavorubredoxin reductase NorW n=1 Tax=Photobacterium rosenbergii TaxID=294936 RepID=A0ABU3ZK89_9GAMM|nr:NADH:flavorubredoxin reductase NorW [Photobacterium rosenbergii]MDV5170308.1 NADH:flavorubredoxin reductase NorW [Photobacterium rosenbergii]
MVQPLVIIGSGFAAYQLVKAIRRQDKAMPIQVFTADDGHDYNKPDLSNVLSKKQTARDLIRMSGQDFAQEHQIELHANCHVEAVNTTQQYLEVDGKRYQYGKLVLATGAKAFVPPISGDAADRVLTLNSLSEYEGAENTLQQANRIAVIGGGLIGTELAMDFATSGKSVVVIDPCQALMANQLPELVAIKLERVMASQGTSICLSDKVESISSVSASASASASAPTASIHVELASGKVLEVDAVISAAGLKPNTQLAVNAGLKVNRGIVVDEYLQTSNSDVYALGDCAEINGNVLAYLQPALLSANALAKTLLGQPTVLVLPNMMVKVKTPAFPIQLAGQNVGRNDSDALSWQIEANASGSTVKTLDENGQLTGYVVTQQHLPNAFPLLKELNS